MIYVQDRMWKRTVFRVSRMIWNGLRRLAISVDLWYDFGNVLSMFGPVGRKGTFIL